MLPDSPFDQPVGSYQAPVPVPDIDPDAEPLETIQVNSTWLEYLRGAAKQLLLQSTWRTDDPDEINLVQQRAFTLIGLLQDTEVPVTTLPVGTVIPYLGNNLPPGGWAYCTGGEVDREGDYAELFALIGTRYGVGDGSTTFNLPDFAGQVLLGVGTVDQNLSYDIQSHGGEVKHQLSTSELPDHTHPLYSTGNGSYTQLLKYDTQYGSSVANNGFSSWPTGGNVAHNNMQPYYAVYWLIKY